uniref:Thioredoxin domain-containing protein 17 n=1 Tax=Phlebotomus kandelakii TaxID=1109342 RepID=A0A6B2E8J9_9DIPT
MVIEVKLQGYENFIDYVNKLDAKGENVNVYFSGSKVDGVSWCPDCNEAEPHVRKALHLAPEKSYFLYVDIGERPFWKDPKCPFRTDKNIHISVLPSFIRWKGPQRLVGVEQISKEDLLEMFLTD